MRNLNDKIICPKCGNIATLENHDVMGADEDNVFCRKCHKEFNPDGRRLEDYLADGDAYRRIVDPTGSQDGLGKRRYDD